MTIPQDRAKMRAIAVLARDNQCDNVAGHDYGIMMAPAVTIGLLDEIDRLTQVVAQQHQGEPVFSLAEPVAPWFYFANCADPDYSRLFNHESEAQTQVADHGGEVVRLWNVPPHADTGEGERLREGIAKQWRVICNQRAELEALRARLDESKELLRKALESSDEATEVFEDQHTGPGRWACHACDGYTNASWRGGKIVEGSAQEIAHDSDCWAEQARKLLAGAPSCDHQFIDDGGFMLVCTQCDYTEDHDPKWRPMETAPKDGTLVRLLVEFEENSTEDEQEAPTIGHNSFGDTGVDAWQFAGWCWSHDHYTQGKGAPVGWLPLLDVKAGKQ